MKYDWPVAEAWGKTGAVLLGSSVVYLAFSTFCAAVLPVGPGLAIATGLLVGLPLWVGSMCYAVLARTTLRAWGVLLGLALLLGGCALLAGVFW